MPADKVSATPRPWSVSTAQRRIFIECEKQVGPGLRHAVAEVLSNRADAALIVLAVNSHAALVEALRERTEAGCKYACRAKGNYHTQRCQEARAVLRQVEEGR